MIDAEVITILGMRGCGKSTLTRALSETHKRKIIFDRMREWTGTHHVTNLEEFKNIWREVFAEENYSIVLLLPAGTSLMDSERIASEIVEIVYRTGLQSGLHTCLIFEEAQFYFPLNGLTPFMFELLTTGRHAMCSIIANTQRPASIAKLLISQSSQVFIGQIFEKRDVDYLVGTVGEVALQAEELQKLEFIHYQIGNRQSQIVTLHDAYNQNNNLEKIDNTPDIES